MTSIHEALSAVMEDVQSVGKTGRNQQQGYSFRGVDAVVNAVGPAFRAHGVVVAPHVEDAAYESYESRNGALMKSCVLRIRYVFTGPEGDTLECVVYGESSDAGDKSTPKAHSVAFRTALLQVLTIPTDEADPDEQSHERTSHATPSSAPSGAKRAGPRACVLCGEALAGEAVKAEGGFAHKECAEANDPDAA